MPCKIFTCFDGNVNKIKVAYIKLTASNSYKHRAALVIIKLFLVIVNVLTFSRNKAYTFLIKCSDVLEIFCYFHV